MATKEYWESIVIGWKSYDKTAVVSLMSAMKESKQREVLEWCVKDYIQWVEKQLFTPQQNLNTDLLIRQEVLKRLREFCLDFLEFPNKMIEKWQVLDFNTALQQMYEKELM